MLRRISIQGYKSIREMSLELRPLNVLIGANGAGKSNLLSFLQMLRSICCCELQNHVGSAGGANSILFGGAKRTQEMATNVAIEDANWNGAYELRLAFASPDSLRLTKQTVSYPDEDLNAWHTSQLGFHGDGATLESGIEYRSEQGDERALAFRALFEPLRLYHFNDTAPTARFHQQHNLHDNRRLLSDAGNLAAVLYRYRERNRWHYERIVRTVRQFAPWFSDFAVEPLKLNEKSVMLSWKHVGFDLEFGSHQLSDGSLRSIALTTLLQQPEEDLPGLLVIDEPELGLHPDALGIVAALIKQVSHHTQVLVATQSATLLDQFAPEDVIVVDREEDASVFRRLGQEELAEWLGDFALSELWEKNYFGGGPFA